MTSPLIVSVETPPDARGSSATPAQTTARRDGATSRKAFEDALGEVTREAPAPTATRAAHDGAKVAAPPRRDEERSDDDARGLATTPAAIVSPPIATTPAPTTKAAGSSAPVVEPSPKGMRRPSAVTTDASRALYEDRATIGQSGEIGAGKRADAPTVGSTQATEGGAAAVTTAESNENASIENASTKTASTDGASTKTASKRLDGEATDRERVDAAQVDATRADLSGIDPSRVIPSRVDLGRGIPGRVDLGSIDRSTDKLRRVDGDGDDSANAVPRGPISRSEARLPGELDAAEPARVVTASSTAHALHAEPPVSGASQRASEALSGPAGSNPPTKPASPDALPEAVVSAARELAGLASAIGARLSLGFGGGGGEAIAPSPAPSVDARGRGLTVAHDASGISAAHDASRIIAARASSEPSIASSAATASATSIASPLSATRATSAASAPKKPSDATPAHDASPAPREATATPRTDAPTSSVPARTEPASPSSTSDASSAPANDKPATAAANRPKEDEAQTSRPVSEGGPRELAIAAPVHMQGAPEAARHEAPGVRSTTSTTSDPTLREAREQRQTHAEVAVSRMTLRSGVKAEAVLPELGRVSVEARPRGESVDVRLTTDDRDTAALLASNRSEMRSDLGRSHVNVAELSVGLGAGSTGSGGSSSRDTGRRDATPTQTQGNDSDARVERETAAATIERRARRVRIVL